MLYKDYIQELKRKFIGKKVIFEDSEYTVIDVDYNGMLLINKESHINKTTAVDIPHIHFIANGEI